MFSSSLLLGLVSTFRLPLCFRVNISPACTVPARKSRWWFYLTTGTSDIDRATSSSHDRVPQLLSWLAAAVVIVAVSDLLALAYIARMFDTVFQDENFAANLEYASPYIGLKELYESGQVNSSKIDPILIRPRVSAQVFVDEPDRLAPRGEHDYWSPAWGTLSPNERHLYVTPKVRAFVICQHRATNAACHADTHDSTVPRDRLRDGRLSSRLHPPQAGCAPGRSCVVFNASVLALRRLPSLRRAPH